MQRFFGLLFGLLILSATLGGCNPSSSPPPQPKEQITQIANEFVEVTRTFLSPVKAGQEITVQIKITAKVDLRAVLLSETLPQGWQLAEGSQNRAAQLGLKAGESLEHSYTKKSVARPARQSSQAWSPWRPVKEPKNHWNSNPRFA